MIAKKTDDGYKYLRRKARVELAQQDDAAAALWKLLHAVEPNMEDWSNSEEGLKIPNSNRCAEYVFRIVSELDERKPSSDSTIPTSHRVRRLWRELRPSHRDLLILVANEERVSQVDLLSKLDMTETQFRSCVAGLAKISKRLGVPYPLVTSGYNQASRSYMLNPSAKKTVLSVDGNGKPR